MYEQALHFGLLGALEARLGDRPLDLGPPKRRLLLTRLLIERGHPVSTSRLCEDLWEGRPASGAVSSLHAHISRLRSVLEPERTRRGEATVLVSGPAGYALDVPAEAVDSHRFEQSVQQARGLLARGHLHHAQREIDQALGMWRGSPLGDAAHCAFAAREIDRIDEVRTAAEELRVALLLQRREPEQAALAAEELTTRLPLREAAWGLLMRALYMAGRPAEALQRYETVRGLLVEELGTDPGPALRDIHLAVLRHDTSTLAPAPHHRTPTVLSRQPAPAAPLVGRAQELARLDDLLHNAALARTSWAVITGEEGSGKSRLAEEFASHATEADFTVAWARCATDLPDPCEQLMSTLSPGWRPSGTPEEIAEQLTGRLSQQPTVCLIEDLHRAESHLRRLLGRYVTLLRNAPLAVVCTSQDTDDSAHRELLTALSRGEAATELPLAPLTVADVHELLLHHSTPFTPGPGESEVHRRGAAELHRRSEGNPFVLSELLKLPADRRTGPHAKIPPAVGRVLKTRLDSLDKDVRTMLEAVAVSGETLDTEILASMGAAAREDLLPLIEAGVSARMLVWERGDARRSGHYRLPQLVREVLLHDLTPVRRQVLHRDVARALAEPPRRHPVRIAQHLLAAGPLVQREEFAEIALEAGVRCAEDGQHAEAVLWFEYAADASEKPELRAEALHATRIAREHLAEFECLSGRARRLVGEPVLWPGAQRNESEPCAS